MHLTALTIGILLGCFIVVKFKQMGYEHNNQAYPMLLASFPIYYWIFSLYSHNYDALINEFMVGVFFIAIAALAYRCSKLISFILLAIGFIGHGVYDIIHVQVFTPSVAPVWWPEFCGAIDILLGLYMLWLIKTQRH